MSETRPSRLTILAWALLICVPPIPAWTASAEYILVPAQSELVVRVYRGGAAAPLAHDHVIRATRFTGTFIGNPAQPTGATGTLTIETASLEADAPELRQKYGLPQTLGATDRQN